MKGSFQYLRLYICPAPGNTSANHMARLVSGRQVAQLRFLRTGFAGWVRLASLLLSCAVSIESMAIFAESADAMVGTSVTCFFCFDFCACAPIGARSSRVAKQICDILSFTFILALTDRKHS